MARPRSTARQAGGAPGISRGHFLLAALLATAGCAGSPAPTQPAPTLPTPSRSLVVLSEQADGGSVTVTAGATVRLVLHSTFWAAPRSSAPDRLAPVAAASSAPSTGPGCRPGSGCGTVTADFLARGAATAATVRLTSTRTSCGEAVRCRPGQADFTVTVVISPATPAAHDMR